MDYRIHRGDTLWALSQRFGTTIEALMRANPQIKDRNLIYTGAHLEVPGRRDSFEPRSSHRPPVTPGGSSRAFQIAMQHLGENASSLKKDSSAVGRAMWDWVKNNVNCANFVSGVLVAAGQIRLGQRSSRVVSLMHHLDRDADFRRVTLANAVPGDVVSFSTGGGGHHVVLFAGWKNGRPQFIGSNNINPDGSQQVSKGGMNYKILAIHHYAG